MKCNTEILILQALMTNYRSRLTFHTRTVSTKKVRSKAQSKTKQTLTLVYFFFFLFCLSFICLVCTNEIDCSVRLISDHYTLPKQRRMISPTSYKVGLFCSFLNNMLFFLSYWVCSTLVFVCWVFAFWFDLICYCFAYVLTVDVCV